MRTRASGSEAKAWVRLPADPSQRRPSGLVAPSSTSTTHHAPEGPHLTDNHLPGQNPTPAHITAAALAITLCGLLTLTGEQLQHLGGAVAVLSGAWPMAATFSRRT